jgi:pyruvate formate lyase activating enzyme
MNGCDKSEGMGLKGLVHGVETGGAVDGPGLRYVLFMSGCQMRCKYCHNPDSWNAGSGRRTTLGEALADVEPYAEFFKKAGGLTISGGEPLMQRRFVGAFMREAKARFGLHVALDTNGALLERVDDTWLGAVDLALLDIKHGDAAGHVDLCGAELAPVERAARRLARLGKPIWLRFVLVPGVNDSEADVDAVGRIAKELGSLERVEVQGFHNMGLAKWEALGRPYEYKDKQPPSAELLARVKAQMGSWVSVPVV